MRFRGPPPVSLRSDHQPYERFLAAELIREKIIRQLGDELPHTTAVEIESFQSDEKGTSHINAVIFVEREGQKRIVIGSKGGRLRSIGTDARLIWRKPSIIR